jgi:hypothetical protein
MNADLNLGWPDIFADVVELLQKWNTLEISRYARMHHVLAQKGNGVRVSNLIMTIRIN